MGKVIHFSSSYLPTLKESPADAEVVSHKLLIRAGLARKMAAGIYVYLPFGLRVINKIAAIVREEMDAAGFQELQLPMVEPGDLWKETGRWEFYGKELLRFKDRNGRDYCLGPTHEEVITDLIRGEIKSYRQLPVRLYQLQTKFRDEIRPRFGLMRGREFLMKDGYSFDATTESAEESYKLMYDAYMRIFSRLGLQFRPVEADTGSIGGSFSHEFMILANTGEDTLALCKNCDYAANVERAEISVSDKVSLAPCPEMAKVFTPGKHTVEEVCQFLQVSPRQLIKTLIFVVDGQPVAVLVRGDTDANEHKLKRMLKAETVELAPAEIVEKVTGAPVGFAGPVKLEIPIYADNELALNNGYITGANEKDQHFMNIDPERDVKVAAWGDLRFAQQGDKCPRCGGELEFTKGIEVGHIFMLGEKYSDPMNAVFLDENGKEQTMIMGCYGIGVSRLAAAAIEQNHDEKGIIFPPEIAPVDCILLNLDAGKDEVSAKARELTDIISAQGLEVLLDDRKERPGVKFNDADLLGIPLQVIVGSKGLARGIAECRDRRTGEKSELELENFSAAFDDWRSRVLAGWAETRK